MIPRVTHLPARPATHDNVSVLAGRRFGGRAGIGINRLGLFPRRPEIPRALRLALLLPVFPLFPLLALVAGLPLLIARAAVIALVARPAGLFPGTIVQLPEGAAERFDLAFIREFLALGQFHQFQNFFHLIHRAFERFDDFHDLIDRLMDGGGTMLLRLNAGDALGQTLDAFEQRPGFAWLRRTAGRDGLRVNAGLWRTLGTGRAFRCGFRGLRSDGFRCRQSSGGSRSDRSCFVGTRRQGFTPAPTAPATAPAMPAAARGWFPAGRCRITRN